MNKLKQWMLGALLLSVVLVPVSSVRADSVEVTPYVSLGADLTEDQLQTVLSLLDVTEAELDEYNDVVQVTNQEEHEYLDDYLSDSVIGTKALSSVKIEKAEEGSGISVVTKNITYCTSGMYTNALTTAGIKDAKVTVAGPFNISGTAALVGAMKAYSSMTGETLSQENADAATNELVVTGELAQDLGADNAEALVAYVKERVLEEDLQSAEEIQEVIEEGASQLNVELTAEQMKKLSALFDKIKGLDLDVDKLKQQADAVYQKMKDLDLDIDQAKGILQSIIDFFTRIVEAIAEWFSSIFG